jgi:hypothetical protein
MTTRTWAARGTLHLLPAFGPYTIGSLRRLDAVVTGPHRPGCRGRRGGSRQRWWS